VSVAVDSGKQIKTRPREPNATRVFYWVFDVVAVCVLAGLLLRDTQAVADVAPHLLAWGLVIAAADSLPIRFWGPATLTMSLPVTLAVGMLFDPLPAALITLVASLDPREIRGEVSFARALFNRSQIALAVLAASAVFHGLGGEAGEWPGMLPPALSALLVDFVLNTGLVVAAASLSFGTRPDMVLKKVLDDSPIQNLFGYLVLGLFAILLATVGVSAGVWGAIAFLAPLALARLTFLQTERLVESSKRLQQKNQALLKALERNSEERRDERLVMAGELHDEVLPPLFKVHLMGQVLRQDLVSGRLLDLDEDLPELLSATQAAQGAIRGVVGDLRKSPIGPAGLVDTLRLFAEQLETAGSPRISLIMSEVEGSTLSQLLTYQVAREAMTNAARYSLADSISVTLWQEEALIRLIVEDDGVGFDPTQVDQGRHFGLQLIMERVEAAEGLVAVQSSVGGGTKVDAALPSQV
jgi:signal transduction histidine kinase